MHGNDLGHYSVCGRESTGVLEEWGEEGGVTA